MDATEVKPRSSAWAPEFLLADSRTRTFLLGLLLAAVTFAVYFQVHTHPFSDLDDRVYLVEDAALHHGLTLSTVWWAFGALNMANWIPVTWLAYAAEFPFFGLDPSGYHMVNVALHACNIFLVFLVLKRATGYTARSFMVAALFALHPMNVEPVVWIAELKTVLSMLFFLLALEAYRWYAAQPGEARYYLVFILFGLGLAAKSQVITFPFLLLLWDYWPLQRMFPDSATASQDAVESQYPAMPLSRLIKEKVPLLVLCVVDAALTIYSQKSVRVGLMPAFSLRFKNAVISYWLYIRKAFWPSGMAPESPQLGRFVSWLQVACVLLLLTGITVLVLMARRRRYLPVGWLWFLVALLPMIGLLQPGQQGMADRFVYQAYLGLFIIACWGVADWARLRCISVAWLAGASAAALVALTLVTYRQIGYWQDNTLLWTHATQVVKHHWMAEDNLGGYLSKQGKTPEAMQHYYKANAINPDDWASNVTIGFHEQSNNPQDAILRYQRALQDYNLPRENLPVVWRNMAVAYRELGDMDKARECLDKSMSFGDQ